MNCYSPPTYYRRHVECNLDGLVYRAEGFDGYFVAIRINKDKHLGCKFGSGTKQTKVSLPNRPTRSGLAREWHAGAAKGSDFTNRIGQGKHPSRHLVRAGDSPQVASRPVPFDHQVTGRREVSYW